MVFAQETFFQAGEERIEYPSPMIGLVSENEDLRVRLGRVRFHFSTEQSKPLQTEIEKGTEQCQRFKESLGDLHNQALDVQNQIATFYSSSFYRDLQQQRETITSLTDQCAALKQKRASLTAELSALTDSATPADPKDSEAANQTMKLIRRLNDARLRKFEEAERYVKLRDAQVKEILASTDLISASPIPTEPEVISETTEVIIGESGESFHMPTSLKSDWISGSAALPSQATEGEEEEQADPP
jgi:hypothetical protein